jgi:hypothetical protein
MTDVVRCDGCGDVARYQHSSYDLSVSLTDPEADPDAIDIMNEGDLCDECARAVARVIKQRGD